MIEWAIALVVCTVYGWIMYDRGYDRGAEESTGIMIQALMAKKGMTMEEIGTVVVEWYNDSEQEEE